jgi:hypothetical protein
MLLPGVLGCIDAIQSVVIVVGLIADIDDQIETKARVSNAPSESDLGICFSSLHRGIRFSISYTCIA